MQVSDVGAARLTDAQPEHPEKGDQGVGLRSVVRGGCQERGVLQWVQHGPVLAFPGDPGPGDGQGRVRGDVTVQDGVFVEPGDGPEPAPGRRWRQPSALHPPAVQLQVRPLGFQRGELAFGAPTQEREHVLAVGPQGEVPVAR